MMAKTTLNYQHIMKIVKYIRNEPQISCEVEKKTKWTKVNILQTAQIIYRERKFN